MLVLEQAHIRSNLSFIKLQNFEFERLSSCKINNFSSLSLSLDMRMPSFGNVIISSVELEFHKIKNCRIQTLLSFINGNLVLKLNLVEFLSLV